MFQLVVGEIGIDRTEFLHTLSFWEIRAVIKGYRCRCRPVYEAARLSAFWVMSAIPFADLRKAGITSPQSMVRFPWEKDDEQDQPTNEQILQLQQAMREFNALSEKEREAKLSKKSD